MSARKPNEIYINRIYDAPVKAVWDAWTDPKQAAKWWGPRGFTITTHSKDLRVGGIWHYTMHGPDGVDYPNKTVYLEVEKGTRLVYDHGGYDDRPPLFRVTVNFSEAKGKTTMEMTMSFISAEAAKEIGKMIKAAGGNGTWDRLAEFLEKEDTGKELFVINRVFDTTISTMFDMWTKPEHFSKWLPPVGMEMSYIKSDIRQGETTQFKMYDSSGFTIYNKLKYIEISKPNRIVYTQQFCDEQGNTSRPPWDPNWPETIVSTVTLTEEEPNKTRVTVRWSLLDSATKEEIAALAKERPNMSVGWTGSFDKLEELVK